jgi:hypothetical protein
MNDDFNTEMEVYGDILEIPLRKWVVLKDLEPEEAG